MIQTILFATDLCVFTPYMLQHVTALADHCKAKIVVVHAVEPLGSLGTAMVKTYLPDSVNDNLQQQNIDAVMATLKEKVIDLLADEFVDSGEVGLQRVRDVVVAPGRPAEIILHQAANKHADLIVMGSHGPDPINGFTLGSVTNKVLQLAKVPVYMVPMLPAAPGEQVDGQQQMSLW